MSPSHSSSLFTVIEGWFRTCFYGMGKCRHVCRANEKKKERCGENSFCCLGKTTSKLSNIPTTKGRKKDGTYTSDFWLQSFMTSQGHIQYCAGASEGSLISVHCKGVLTWVIEYLTFRKDYTLRLTCLPTFIDMKRVQGKSGCIHRLWLSFFTNLGLHSSLKWKSQAGLLI